MTTLRSLFQTLGSSIRSGANRVLDEPLEPIAESTRRTGLVLRQLIFRYGHEIISVLVGALSALIFYGIVYGFSQNLPGLLDLVDDTAKEEEIIFFFLLLFYAPLYIGHQLEKLREEFEVEPASDLLIKIGKFCRVFSYLVLSATFSLFLIFEWQSPYSWLLFVVSLVVAKMQNRRLFWYLIFFYGLAFSIPFCLVFII